MESIADGLEDAFEDAAEAAANRWSVWARDRASELSPVASVQGLSPTQLAGSRGRPPGTFKESWKPDPAVRVGKKIRAGFFSDDRVAAWIEYGTRPHVIRPSPGRQAASVVATGRPRRSGTDPQAALRFYVNGRPVYARVVHHPGTRGQFIAHRVAQEGIPVLRDLLKEELQTHLHRRYA